MSLSGQEDAAVQVGEVKLYICHTCIEVCNIYLAGRSLRLWQAVVAGTSLRLWQAVYV